ncbi:MAG: 30S ribosomal protein S16 [Candidatus Doudnabacteria bacterium]|nr:30S ribosomal protein S16 [Candidatus Doudnabacteria bacterium]
MLTIRLQRVGTKNSPAFRVVLAEKHRSVSKKFLEVLGHYNPRNKELGIKDKERLNYWVAQNVSLTPSVKNLLIEKKFIEGAKVKAWKPKKKEQPKEEIKAEGEAKPQGGAEAQAPQVKAEVKSEPEPTEAEPKAEAQAPQA